MNLIKQQLQNNVTLTELRDAENRQAPTPRTLKKRIEQFQFCIQIVKRNKDLDLNNQMDQILEIELQGKKVLTRRANSCTDLKRPGLEQDESDKEFIESWPGAPRDEESKLRHFHEYLAERE